MFDRNGDLFAIAVDGSRTVRLTNTPVAEYSPDVSNDGRSIAYARADGIWTMRLDGSRRERVTRNGGDPTWSPDGETIVFTRRGPKDIHGASCNAIFSVRTDGRNLRRLTRLPGSQYNPDVSPDSLIAFTHANQCEGGTTSYALRVIEMNGRRSNQLSKLPGNAYYPIYPEYESPAWSPDGAKLVMLADLQLTVSNSDGSKPRNLLRRTFSAANPEWSPDGKWIAFTTYTGAHDLHIIRPDGSGLKRLTRTKSGVGSPSWLPRLP